jgi:hypothetical protein
MSLAEGHAIEVVRGRRDAGLDDELVAFWTAHGALSEAVARVRLEHVVCVLRDEDGAIVAANSVFDEAIPALGGCRLWVSRSFASSPEARAAADEMLAAARDRLAEEFDPDSPGPIGICRMIGDREIIRTRREPVWPVSELMFAGYTAGGEQLRVVYFEGAKVV